ncbi:MAG: sortase, partial [Actinomycetota bacterium]|nr:sortase [Actinomycetota bacterium]
PRPHPRRRAPRLGPMERRRARELGPPPVPHFGSRAQEPEADLDLHDDGFAATGVWDAPADRRDPDGSGLPAARHVEAGPEPSPAPWGHEPNGASGSNYEAEVGRAPAFPDAPAELDRGTSSRADGYEDDDDLGPPAPFYAPALTAESRNGSAPPAEAERVAASDPADVPAHPPESLPGPESGRTLAFWSVPSQPERPKRRLSLKNLRRPRLKRPRFRRPTRAGLMRALPFILLAVGGLLLLEGALTVLWKEPFSAIFAAQTQSALDDDLDKLERDGAAAEAAARSRKAAVAYQRRRSVSLNRDAGTGEAVGRLKIKKIDLNTVVVQGTDEGTLTKGPGHYSQTPLPGQKGNWTVGIAGHRTTYDAPFRNIDKLERGDNVVFSTPYGRFTYAIEGTEIVDAAETGVFVPKGYDRIALTACHPLYSAAQRIIAYGKLKKSEPLGNARRAARS